MTETEVLADHTTAVDVMGIIYTALQVMEFGYTYRSNTRRCCKVYL